MSRLLFFCLCAIMVITSCDRIDLGGETDEGSLLISIHSSTGAISDIPFPVNIYAYNKKGECAAHVSVASASDNKSLNISEGDYDITAFSLSEGYTFPTSTASKATIKPSSEAYSIAPLYYCCSRISATNSPATLSLTMQPAVCRLSITLNDMPEDAKQVSASIQPVSEAITLGGELLERSSATIPCTKDDADCWTTGHVILLPYPSSATQIAITIVFSDGSASSYAFTYNAPLSAGKQYILKGSYLSLSNDALGNSIAESGWSEPITEEFTFGPGNNDHHDTDEENYESENITLPEGAHVGEKINDLGIIAHIENADVLLLSLVDWDGMTSAFNEKTPTMAEDIAKSFNNSGRQGWMIPTEKEARTIYEVFEDQIDVTNDKLKANGYDPLMTSDASGTSIRYLCEDATKTFSFANSTIKTAGKTVKNYHMRLVKHCKISTANK